MAKSKKQIKRGRKSVRRIIQASASVRGKRARFKAARSAAIAKARAGLRRIEKLSAKILTLAEPLGQLLGEADGLSVHVYKLSDTPVAPGGERSLRAVVDALTEAIGSALDDAKGEIESEIDSVRELPWPA